MSRRSLVLFVLAIMSFVASPGRAVAGPPGSPLATPDASTDPTLVAEGLFGADTPSGSGWTEVLARVDNTTGSALDGSAELFASSYADAGRTAFSAPVHLPPGGTAYLRMPLFPGRASASSEVVLRASDGKVLARENVRLSRESTPFLVLVDGASLGAALRSYGVPRWDAGRNNTNLSALALGTPSADRATGNPILPEHAAAYATVSVLLMRSDRLARLQGLELEALRSWVNGGGALAVVLARPEDLRHPNVVSLVGGEAHEAPAPLKRWSTLATAVKTNGAFDEPAEDPSAAVPHERMAGVLPYPLTPAQRRHWKTGAQLAPRLEGALVSFAGGALEESDFGATARYGLGEVHLLGFDPSAPALLDDPWVHGRIVEMVARAWDRNARLVFPMGTADSDNSSPIRRMLDPNESFRPGLAIAGLLLLLYSVGAGPVLFRIMRKRQKPLFFLRWTPALSALAFFGIVGIGLMTKGIHGRARQLTLVEAGGGEARGTARRFRGFYGSGSVRLAVGASEPGSLLSTQSDEDSARQEGILRPGTGGVVLDDIASAPWQTVVVREDMTASLGAGGISILPADGALEIVNGSGYELRDVMVHVPGQSPHGVYFASIASGARVRSAAAAIRLPSGYVSRSGSEKTLGRPEFSSLNGLLAARDVERISEVWEAFVSAGGWQRDFFPWDPLESTCRHASLSIL